MKEEEKGWKHSPGLHVGQYLSGLSGMLFSTQVYFFSFSLFSNQWPHCILGGQLLFELFTTTSFHPQSKFISCYDITVELQRLEELYAGRETEEKLRSKWNPQEGSSFYACVPVLNKMQCHLCGTTHPLKLLEKCFWHFWVADFFDVLPGLCWDSKNDSSEWSSSTQWPRAPWIKWIRLMQ